MECNTIENARNYIIRYVIQFRKARNILCSCKHPCCDNNEIAAPVNTVENPVQYEKKYVADVYNDIASHFSDTRYNQWPRVKKFIDAFEPNSLICDSGCGNGKYMNNDSMVMVGTDLCIPLLTLAITKNPYSHAIACNSMQLPLVSDIFDGAISIAVIHHFANE